MAQASLREVKLEQLFRWLHRPGNSVTREGLDDCLPGEALDELHAYLAGARRTLIRQIQRLIPAFRGDGLNVGELTDVLIDVREKHCHQVRIA